LVKAYAGCQPASSSAGDAYVDNKSNALNEIIFPGNVACYEELKTTLGDGLGVAFTGAGTSTPLYPTWTGLLKELVDQADKEGLVEKDNLQELSGLVYTDPLELASHLEEIFTKHRFREQLATIFESKGSTTHCHDFIIKLPLKAIVTLNYDDGLESAFSTANSAVPLSIRAQDRAQLVRWQQGRLFGTSKLPILHWHGMPSDPEQMIFTGDDYNLFYNNRQNVDFVEQLWRNNRLLVIGFGFSDPFLIRVVESTLRALPSDNRHFAFIGVQAGKQITPLIRRQFTKKYRLTPIFYEIRPDGARDDHSDLTKMLCMLMEDGANVIQAAAQSHGSATPQPNISESATNQAAYRDFEQGLLVSPGGRTLYAEPRLLRPIQLSGMRDDITYEALSINHIVHSSSSFVITTRAEFGSTTLCRRIVNDMLALGVDAVYRDANVLPNYKIKLRQEFGLPKNNPNPTQVLVLDAFNVNRHERLLKEIIGLQHFTRVVLVLKSSDPTPLTSLDGAFGIKFESLVLSHLDRTDIRSLATDLFDSSDTDLISAVVDKVYGDLLSLCIPLTPANIIMYLTILYREGDFSPLNRVQIVDRYLQELLRRPSDAYQESFSAKNKMDVISSFVYSLYISQKTIFTETDWLSFCRQHMIDTLLAFNERSLLNDLLSCRIFVSFDGRLVFKYKVFYSYFLGRHVANRSSLIYKLMEQDAYLAVGGLVEVITALSADNSPLIGDIVGKLENSLSQLESRYPLRKSDPFTEIEWPANADEEERLWQPVSTALAAGPLASDEVDKLKRSIQAEHRTGDQAVIFFEFDRLERKIVAYYKCLADALGSSDALDGNEKKRALRAAFDTCNLFYIVGLLHCSRIARHRIFYWNGLAFVNDVEFPTETHDSAVKQAVVIASLMPNAIAAAVAMELGSKKLGEVYRALSATGEMTGFKKLLLLVLLMQSKPHNWLTDAKDIVATTERKSMYMRFMLYAALTQFREEVNTVNEREGLKTLIATIRARRDLKKNNVGARIVGRVQKRLEDAQYFAEPKT
jgi:hypothetical protein